MFKGKKDETKPNSDPFAEDKAQQAQKPTEDISSPTKNIPISSKPGVIMTK